MHHTEPHQKILNQQGEDVRYILHEAMRSVEPYRVMEAGLCRDGNRLLTKHHEVSLNQDTRIWVFGVGKAAAEMAQATEKLLGDDIYDGIVIVPEGEWRATSTIQLMEGSHPLPDNNSLASALEMRQLMEQVQSEDVVLFLLSGGASSLACIPAGEMDVEEDLRPAYDVLLKSGATIQEMNTVRRHLSQIKGGNLAGMLPGCRVIQLVISDVPGNTLCDIGSGPLVADPTSYDEALQLLRKYDLYNRLPDPVIDHLKQGKDGLFPETLKDAGELEAEILTEMPGSSDIIAEQARRTAAELGYEADFGQQHYSGHTRQLARRFAGDAIRRLSRSRTMRLPAALIYHGESYLNVTGRGKGGRNQELALAFAIAVEGQHAITMLSGATDGVDGPTDAAGAICNSETALKARDAGFMPEGYLMNNDSYSFFDAMNGLVITGPTGTNVMDLQIVLIDK